MTPTGGACVIHHIPSRVARVQPRTKRCFVRQAFRRSKNILMPRLKLTRRANRLRETLSSRHPDHSSNATMYKLNLTTVSPSTEPRRRSRTRSIDRFIYYNHTLRFGKCGCLQ